MSQSEKATFLRRRREARLLKTKEKSSRSYVHRVPFGCIKTGVCFPAIAPEGDSKLRGNHD